MRPVEQLESRRLFASFTASSVAELIGDINAANAAGGANTITLAAGALFKLGAVDNNTDGPTGLPVIAPGDDLTIVGNGDAIQRSTAKGTPEFRILDVAAGGSLALSNLILSRGSGAGGGVLSRGSLSLNGVTVENCTVQAGLGGTAAGGGVYSTGVLTISDSAIQNNKALGGDGYSFSGFPVSGGSASGGGLYIGGGTAAVTNSTFSSNLARGGNGVNASRGGYSSSGGAALGGGIYVGAGTLTVRSTAIVRNTATGGAAGNVHSKISNPFIFDGVGSGGGLYIAAGASVGLDPFTQANTVTNSASTRDNDIFGSFTILA